MTRQPDTDTCDASVYRWPERRNTIDGNMKAAYVSKQGVVIPPFFPQACRLCGSRAHGRGQASSDEAEHKPVQRKHPCT